MKPIHSGLISDLWASCNYADSMDKFAFSYIPWEEDSGPKSKDINIWLPALLGFEVVDGMMMESTSSRWHNHRFPASYSSRRNRTDPIVSGR